MNTIKIVVALGVFGPLFVLNAGVDFLELLINFTSLTIVGLGLQVINLFFDVVVGFITQAALFFLGGRGLIRRQVIQLLGWLAEFIPGIDTLPLRTITLLINVVLFFSEEIIKGPLLQEGEKGIEEKKEEPEEKEEETKEEAIEEETTEEEKSQ
jgi:hypothetical protein